MKIIHKRKHRFPRVQIEAQYHPVGDGQTRLIEVWTYHNRTEKYVEDELYDGAPVDVAKGHDWRLYPDAILA